MLDYYNARSFLVIFPSRAAFEKELLWGKTYQEVTAMALSFLVQP